MYFGDVLGYVSNNGTGFLNMGYPQIHEIIMISVESATKCGNTRRFSAPYLPTTMSPCASLRRTWYLEWRTYGTVWIGRCAMVLIYCRISCLASWFDDSCQICWYDMILPYLTWVQMNWSFLRVRQYSFGRHDGPQGLNHLTYFLGAKLPASYCCFVFCQWICFRLFPWIFV